MNRRAAAVNARQTLVIFDIDGTLLATAGIHHDLIAEVLARDDLDVLFQPWGAYRHYTDRGVIDELIRHALGRPMAEADLERYDEAYRVALVARLGDSPISEIAGAKRLIADLSDMPDVRMCFATGSLRKMAVVKLSLLGVDGNAVALATGSDYLSREEIVVASIRQASGDLDGDFDVVILGDGAWDERTAANLAIPFVAVQSGMHVFGEGPVLTVEDFRALSAETLVSLAAPYRPQVVADVLSGKTTA
jgi:phosphoglycolate phosphatase-like HAD superfamily hydrolase